MQKAKLRLDDARPRHQEGRDRPRQAGRERTAQAHHCCRRRRRAHAAAEAGSGSPPTGREAEGVDRAGRGVPAALGLRATEATRRPASRDPKPKSATRSTRFILAQLEKEGLKPSPEADKATLIRRVTLDLTGLPPTPEEVEAFLKDDSPNAYEKVVDRLLASPHYGERQARHWLDLARYADRNGYTIDGPRQIWPYRDWVIKALNDDMPFDQFTIEQLAGDLLPNATTEQKVATGFHRNTPINEEGGIDPEQFRVERPSTASTPPPPSGSA